MINLSYNISSALEESLKKIETLRAGILLSIIPPKTELKIRWESMILRTYGSLNLAGNSLTKEQIEKVLIEQPKNLETEEKAVIKYKNAFDFIAHNWLVNKETLTPKTVIALHDLCLSGKLRSTATSLKTFCDYLQVNPEHPVIQAGVGLAQLTGIAPFANGNNLTARLFAYLILYKHGYDFRGMLVLEKEWQKEPVFFRDNLQNGLKNGNITIFLEFFAQGIVDQLNEVLSHLKSNFWESEKHLNTSISEPWDIDERQKKILSYLEQTETTITNRRVQKLFSISQITASRDLAKLARLGLIFVHGKGRSVYYSKV